MSHKLIKCTSSHASAQTVSALCTRLCQPLLAKILCHSALMKHWKSSHCSITRVKVSCSLSGLTYTRPGRHSRMIHAPPKNQIYAMSTG